VLLFFLSLQLQHLCAIYSINYCVEKSRRS